MWTFQPTHPHGVRPRSQTWIAPVRRFQPTHPHGVRQLWRRRSATGVGFNPRTRTGCDWRYYVTASVFKYRFNPRTRTGCDIRAQAWTLPTGVSTHAPARGATVFILQHHGITMVSTHAPARGATCLSKCLVHCIGFQPTHPHGVRPHSSFPYLDGQCFNPRTRTGCDSYSLAM